MERNLNFTNKSGKEKRGSLHSLMFADSVIRALLHVVNVFLPYVVTVVIVVNSPSGLFFQGSFQIYLKRFFCFQPES